MVLLALSVAGVQWSSVTVTGALLLVTVVLWIAADRMDRPRLQASPGLTALDLPAFGVLAVHGFLVARQAVGEWDFWALWGLKGRVFFGKGAVDWTFLGDPHSWFQHPDYPLLLPLNYVFVAMQGNGWSDRWLGLITTLFAVSLVLVARDALARELPRHLAALAALAVAGVAASPWVGMAEAPLVAFGATGLLMLREGRMPLGAVLLGLAAWTKNEGLSLIVAAAVGLLLVRRGRDILRLWPALLLPAPWLMLRVIHGLSGDLLPGAFQLARIGMTLRAVAHNPPERPLLWAGLAAVFVMYVGSLRRERFLLAACTFQVVVYFCAYWFTPHEVEWHVRYSWTRLLDHVAVPLVFVASTLAGRGIGKQEPASEPVR